MTSFTECCRHMSDSRWLEFWLSHGIRVTSKKKEQTPCPNCGGNDRFMWDNENNDGSFFCRKCGAGNGLTLVERCSAISWEVGLTSLSDFLNLVPDVAFYNQSEFDESLESYQAASDSHPYLRRKELQPHGLLQQGKSLLVVLGDYSRPVQTAQLIGEDGKKRYLKGSKAGGLFHTLAGTDAMIIICEGWGTGARLFEATGCTVICAMAANQLVKVSKEVRKRNTKATIIICADNDEGGGENPGVAQATLAAQETGSKLCIPPPGDFADIFDHLEIAKILDTAEYMGSASEVKDEMIEALNAEFAFTRCMGKNVAIEVQKDVLSFIPLPVLKTDYENKKKVPIATKMVNQIDWWTQHPGRSTYNEIVFKPGRKALPGEWNLWKGWRVEPIKGDCELFYLHVRERIAMGNEDHFRYILAWFANMLQTPNNKPGVALVLRGRQGAGKSILGEEVFGPILGPCYRIIDEPRSLVGQFNGIQDGCLLMQVEEAFWAGNKSAEGRLKGLITSKRNNIERKGLEQYEIDNLMRVMMTSNHDWVVPAAADDRRFAVFDVLWPQNKIDRVFFKHLVAELANGGLQALLYDLLEFDLTSVDLRQLPETAAKADQKEETAARDPLTNWMITCLGRKWFIHANEDWGDPMTSGDFYKSFEEWHEARKGLLVFYGTPNKVTSRLHKMFGVVRGVKGWILDTRYRKSVGTKRINTIKFGGYDEVIKAFYENTGIVVESEWDEEQPSLSPDPADPPF